MHCRISAKDETPRVSFKMVFLGELFMKSVERNDLIVSWLGLSVAFALAMGGGFLGITSFPVAFPLALVAVGTAFIFHEIAHRNTARKFGFHSEYRVWQVGLIFAILLSFTGFVFAMPGATYILGAPNRKQNGIISVAGAVVNILFGLGFSLLYFLNLGDWLSMVFYFGAYINFFIAMFNMLPIWILDGKKVLAWNGIVWAVVFFSGLIGWLMLGGIR